jgi:glycine cleavage system H protein
VKDNGDGTAIVGITDFAQSELGDIVFVEVESIGSEYSQDEVFGSIEAVKTVSDLYIPLSGKIIEINNELDSTPELVNNHPYGDGWIIKMEYSDPSELESLLSADDYQSITG